MMFNDQVNFQHGGSLKTPRIEESPKIYAVLFRVSLQHLRAKLLARVHRLNLGRIFCQLLLKWTRGSCTEGFSSSIRKLTFKIFTIYKMNKPTKSEAPNSQRRKESEEWSCRREQSPQFFLQNRPKRKTAYKNTTKHTTSTPPQHHLQIRQIPSPPSLPGLRGLWGSVVFCIRAGISTFRAVLRPGASPDGFHLASFVGLAIKLNRRRIAEIGTWFRLSCLEEKDKRRKRIFSLLTLQSFAILPLPPLNKWLPSNF